MGFFFFTSLGKFIFGGFFLEGKTPTIGVTFLVKKNPIYFHGQCCAYVRISGGHHGRTEQNFEGHCKLLRDTNNCFDLQRKNLPLSKWHITANLAIVVDYCNHSFRIVKIWWTFVTHIKLRASFLVFNTTNTCRGQHYVTTCDWFLPQYVVIDWIASRNERDAV